MNHNMNANMAWWSGDTQMGGTSLWWIVGAALLLALIGAVIWAVIKRRRGR
jgi:dolichyl-phosphate-mannose--protein O-mannosyl transferase